MSISSDDYVIMRCDDELVNNSDYMKLQKLLSNAYKDKNIELYSNLSAQLQYIVELTSYHAAVHDAKQLFTI
jgi:hypothetical protein